MQHGKRMSVIMEDNRVRISKLCYVMSGLKAKLDMLTLIRKVSSQIFRD